MPSIVRLAGSGTLPMWTPMLSSVNPCELGDGLGSPAPRNVTLSRGDGTGSGANVARIFAKHYKLTGFAARRRICSEPSSGPAPEIPGIHEADRGVERRIKPDANDITT
jgi:hypothetical protein